jgi:general secretion pathway protein H
MTLIEIMVVLVIVGGLSVAIVSRLNKGNNDLKAAIRKISTLTKELHNQARMQNRVLRMVIDMNEQEGSSISVEGAPKNTMLTDSAFSDKADAEEDDKLSDEEKKEKQALRAFQPDGSVLKRPLRLPLPVKIVEVEIKNLKNPIEEGKAYLYFFPQGLTQEAVIVISDGKNLNWTIAVNAITGISQVIGERKKLSELRN